MRRMFSVALAAALALCVAGTASATTTIDLTFGVSGTNVTTLSAPGTLTMGVFMTTDDPLEIFATTVFWDNSDTDAIAGTLEWVGFFDAGAFVLWAPLNPGPSGVFIDNSVNQVNSFDAASLGDTLPAGTYQLGTIVFLAAVGTTNIISGIISGLDGFALTGGTIIDGAITFNGATINVVPEPATASLLGLGLIGLILAGRRKRA